MTEIKGPPPLPPPPESEGEGKISEDKAKAKAEAVAKALGKKGSELQGSIRRSQIPPVDKKTDESKLGGKAVASAKSSAASDSAKSSAISATSDSAKSSAISAMKELQESEKMQQEFVDQLKRLEPQSKAIITAYIESKLGG